MGRVIGSVVTADLTGQGYDDVIVPTINGAVVLDGQTGARISDLSPHLGLQNSPLVTDDPNGTIGITLAGYGSRPRHPRHRRGQPLRDHRVQRGRRPRAGSWPMFHHDPQLTGDAGGTDPGAGAGLPGAGAAYRATAWRHPTEGSSPSGTRRSAGRPGAST